MPKGECLPQVFGGLLQIWNSSCLPEQTVQALELVALAGLESGL